MIKWFDDGWVKYFSDWDYGKFPMGPYIYQIDVNTQKESDKITELLNKLKTVNTDDFDIIPKKSKIEKDLAAAEERKRNAEKSKEMSVAAYDRQILAIDDEIKELKKKLK